MRRALSLWFPTFSTDLAARRTRSLRGAPAEPGRVATGAGAILLTRRVASRELIARRCARAAAAGVTEGMDLTHARSLLPAGLPALVEEHRPDRDGAALHALACWATRFSPLVAPDPPDGLVLDVTGTQRLHRGEAALVRTVSRAVRRLGLRVRVGAASTFACAWAVARYGVWDLAGVPPGREREALSALPVAALDPDPAAAEALAEIGLSRIGHVLDLPRSGLPSRFGAGLLLRLDRALGQAMEHLEPVRPEPPPRAELLFDGPTTQWESVEAAAQHALDDLVRRLARLERGVRRLDLSILRPHAPPERVAVTLSRPSSNRKHLRALLRTRLERVDTGRGVEGLTLTASRTARLRHEQRTSRALGAEPGAAGETARAELIDTLVERLGADGVVRFEPLESHLPERAFRARSVMEEPARTPGAPMTPYDRPTVLHPRPEPARVLSLTPDGPVLSLRWRGRDWRVVACTGPERIGPEWWRWGGRIPPPPDRDYFAVQTESGRWLWVCRQDGTGRWFVHGEWA